MSKKIEQINELHKEFYDLSLEDFPGFAPTQRDLIDLIDSWWISKYVNGDYDENNQKKPFYNSIRAPVFVAGKMTDIDTKDIRIIPKNGQPMEPALLLQRDLSIWMQETKIAELLNTIKWMRPKYGTVVVKKVVKNGSVELKIVPLQNLRMDVTAKSLKDSFFVSEWHRFLPDQLRKKAKEQGWNNEKVEDIIQKSKKQKYIVVWEHYGEMENEDGNYFVLGESPGNKGHIIDSATVDDLPYRELHWDTVEGRWLGLGSVERGAEAQIQLNRSAQLKANALHWTSKHIYQTEDDNINRNLMTDVKDGDIIRSRRGINPVVMEERNLSAYREEWQTWMENLNKDGFIQDVTLGRTPAAGTPLGTTQMMAAQAGSFFEQKREEFAIFIKELLWDFVIPEFKKLNHKEHWINFVGASEDEVKVIERIIRNERVRANIADYVRTNKAFPYPDKILFMKSMHSEMLKRDEAKWRKIPKGFYDNLKFKIDLVITGESMDLQNKIQAIQIAMQTSQDPNEIKELRKRLLQIVGERPVPEEEQVGMTDVAGAMQQQRGPTRPGQQQAPAPKGEPSPPAVRTPNVSPGKTRQEMQV